jgi:hypothetical protein
MSGERSIECPTASGEDLPSESTNAQLLRCLKVPCPRLWWNSSVATAHIEPFHWFMHCIYWGMRTSRSLSALEDLVGTMINHMESGRVAESALLSWFSVFLSWNGWLCSAHSARNTKLRGSFAHRHCACVQRLVVTCQGTWLWRIMGRPWWGRSL